MQEEHEQLSHGFRRCCNALIPPSTSEEQTKSPGRLWPSRQQKSLLQQPCLSNVECCTAPSQRPYVVFLRDVVHDHEALWAASTCGAFRLLHNTRTQIGGPGAVIKLKCLWCCLAEYGLSIISATSAICESCRAGTLLYNNIPTRNNIAQNTLDF